MPEAIEDEAYQILLAKLPTFVTTWVVEEQEKRKFKSPKVILGPMPGYEESEVSLSVETRLGQRPRRIEKRQNHTFVIEFTKEEDIQKMLCLNGRRLRGGTPLRVQQVNQYMTVMEVFEWVGRKFAVRDKVDHTQKYQGGGHQRRERVTKKTESLPALSPGTPASSMDGWGPDSEDDRQSRPATPRRHGRSA